METLTLFTVRLDLAENALALGRWAAMAKRHERRLLTLQGAAEALSVSVSTLRAWCRGGALMIPVVRMGRDLRFDPDELWMWVKKRTEYPPAGKVVPFPWRAEDKDKRP
jgi:excisionase family DNA binding protein